MLAVNYGGCWLLWNNLTVTASFKQWRWPGMFQPLENDDQDWCQLSGPQIWILQSWSIVVSVRGVAAGERWDRMGGSRDAHEGSFSALERQTTRCIRACCKAQPALQEMCFSPGLGEEGRSFPPSVQLYFISSKTLLHLSREKTTVTRMCLCSRLVYQSIKYLCFKPTCPAWCRRKSCKKFLFLSGGQINAAGEEKALKC